MGLTRLKRQVLFLTLSATLPAAAADDTTSRCRHKAEYFPFRP